MGARTEPRRTGIAAIAAAAWVLGAAFLGAVSLGAAAPALASPVVAQKDEIKVAAGLNDSAMYLGDALLLTVKVTGAEVGSIRPTFPDVSGVRFDGPHRSTNRSTFIGPNGRREEISTEFTYRVTGIREGEHEIPRFPIDVEGERYWFDAKTIRVVKPETDDRFFVTTTVDRDTCYPNEPVRLVCRLWISSDTSVDRLYQYEAPILGSLEKLRMKVQRPSPGADAQDLVMSSVRIPAEVSIEERKGRRYQVYTVRWVLYPDKSGELFIPPTNAQASIRVGRRRVTGFGGGRVRAETKRVYALSDPLTVTVKDIPVEGRPEGYYGLVGQYRIEASLDRSRVKVGDPILLTMRVTGDGLLETVRRPDLASLEEFSDFKIDEDLSPGDVQGNSVVFEQTIRARSAGVQELPPIPLAFFDGRREEFRVLSSSAVPLDVEATRIVTPDQIEGPDGTVRPNVEKQELETTQGGLNANYIYSDALVDQTVELSTAWLPLLSPLAYALLLIGLRLKSRSAGDESKVRARGARKRGREQLAGARSKLADDDRAFFEALSLALHRYLVDRFGLGEGEITPADVARLQAERRIKPESAVEATALLEEADWGRFGSNRASTAEREALLERVEALMGRIEKE